MSGQDLQHEKVEVRRFSSLTNRDSKMKPSPYGDRNGQPGEIITPTTPKRKISGAGMRKVMSAEELENLSSATIKTPPRMLMEQKKEKKTFREKLSLMKKRRSDRAKAASSRDRSTSTTPSRSLDRSSTAPNMRYSTLSKPRSSFAGSSGTEQRSEKAEGVEIGDARDESDRELQITRPTTTTQMQAPAPTPVKEQTSLRDTNKTSKLSRNNHISPRKSSRTLGHLFRSSRKLSFAPQKSVDRDGDDVSSGEDLMPSEFPDKEEEVLEKDTSNVTSSSARSLGNASFKKYMSQSAREALPSEDSIVKLSSELSHHDSEPEAPIERISEPEQGANSREATKGKDSHNTSLARQSFHNLADLFRGRKGRKAGMSSSACSDRESEVVQNEPAKSKSSSSRTSRRLARSARGKEPQVRSEPSSPARPVVAAAPRAGQLPSLDMISKIDQPDHVDDDNGNLKSPLGGTIEVEIVEDEKQIFNDGTEDDDEKSFVSVENDMEVNDVPPPPGHEEDEDMEDEDRGAEWGLEDEDDYEEEDDDDDEGRKLTQAELDAKQERENEDVERILRSLQGGGMPRPRKMSSAPRTPDRQAHNTNMDSSKKLEIGTIESRMSRQGSVLASRYRERRSMSEDARNSARKNSFNPKSSSTARILAMGLNNDFDQTTIMFGGTDAMLDYIEDSETDDTVYNDPLKRSMKFAACRALIGDLLEESNVYSATRVDQDEEE